MVIQFACGRGSDKVEQAITSLKGNLKVENRLLIPIAPIDVGSMFLNNAVEVVAGGATIFILDVKGLRKHKPPCFVIL